MFTSLHAVVVPTLVFAAAEAWGSGDSDGRLATLPARIERAAGELASLIAKSNRSARTLDSCELSVGFDWTGASPSR